MRCRYTRDPTHARMAVHRLRSEPDRVRQQDCGITLCHPKGSAGEVMDQDPMNHAAYRDVAWSPVRPERVGYEEQRETANPPAHEK